ncbi:hypothetical protein [Microbacterium sp. Bi128]|uniref:hypothetical protein n=1 Tax=Microbacterium sp. Bi128 TaxID=2821115 RepID=UPI001E4B7534|nr:hypothetical protein [Microbacterium sp. Bi128]
MVLDGQTYSFSRLTLGEARGWSRGDVVKVVADDPAPTARYAAGATSIPRIGEFATVLRVDGTTLDLVSTLIDAYQDNVRVARLAPGSVAFLGGTWDVSDDVFNGRVVGGAIRCTNLIQPAVLDQVVLREVGQPVMMRSCFGYLVERQLVKYAMNAPENSPSIVGYGIVDQGSMHGRARDCRTLDGRHGWTDVAASVGVNGDLALYGRTMLAKIFGAQVTAAGNSGLDTHHGSYGIEFHGATVVGAPGAHTGFALRGEKHRVVGSTVIGCENAVTVFNDTTGSGDGTAPESREHYVSNLRTIDTRRVVNVEVHGTGHQSAGQRDDRSNLHVGGLYAQGAGQLARIVNGRARISNATVDLGSSVTGPVMEALNSQLIIEADINAEGVTAATDTPRIAYSAGSDIRYRGRLSASNDYQTAVGPQPFHCESSTQRADFDVTFEQPWASDNLFRVQEAITKASVVWRVLPDSADATTQRSSAALEIVGSDLETSTYPARLLRSIEPNLLLLARTKDGVARTLGPLAPAKFIGQRLTVSPSSLSGTFTVRHGSSYGTALMGASDKVVSVGQFLTLIWLGTAWTQEAAL